MTDEEAILTAADAAAWLAWLSKHHEHSSGIWLRLAKKGTTEPTRLSYDEALEEALCHGWIDGQVRRLDELTYRQRFTPRRARSAWSKRNINLVERLTGEGRMKPAGMAAVERAKADGRWEAAYPGQADDGGAGRPRCSACRPSLGRRLCSRSSRARIAMRFCCESTTPSAPTRGLDGSSSSSRCWREERRLTHRSADFPTVQPTANPDGKLPPDPWDNTVSLTVTPSAP